MPNALIVDDDRSSLHALAALVEKEGFHTTTAENLEKARVAVMEQKPDVVLADLILPDGRGTDLLTELEADPQVEVILVTGNATLETAVEALRRGAYDYLTKPVDVPRLKTLLAGLTRTRELKREVSSLRQELRKLGRFGDLVGTSQPMQEVYDLIDRVAPTDASVLVVGESGTGKELVAQTLHRLSRRKQAPMLPINCGAISPNLIESELFGHERGSFTGANRQHKGYFERVSGGTLFLDEITEMPTELQVKLLRVLETGKILRVGGVDQVAVDVRVVAATNRVPEEAVAEGKLREDLFYRLNVFPIELPSLRRRGDDVVLLARHFLEQLNEQNDEGKRLTEEALEKLRRYPWPGNVRELQNTLQRGYILADEEITPDNLPVTADSGTVAGVGGGPYLHLKVGSSIAEAERRLLLATLDHCDGDKREAAGILGISLKTLYNRLNSYAGE
jgi:DNA-binding NtrC family response regulator